VTLKDGRTGKDYAYDTWGSYGRFLRLIPFEDELMEPRNKGFKEALAGALFPGIPEGKADGSLAWLMEAYSRLGRQPETSADGPFSQRIRVKPRWTAGEIVPPRSYYLVTDDEKLLGSLPISDVDGPKAGLAGRQAWLVYYGHNHGALEPVIATGEVRVFRSAHGVVVNEGGRSCWVFVNDEILTAGPDKLRWPSIKDVQMAEGLVFIHHAGTEEHLYVVDHGAGVAGRLAPEIFPPAGGRFEVRDGRLFVQGEAGTRELALETLKNRLK
jgi:hypothetical protein